MYPKNIIFNIKNEKFCVWLGQSYCQTNCIFSSKHPLISIFFPSLSHIKTMETPSIPNTLKNKLSLNKLEYDYDYLKNELQYLPCLIFPKQDLKIRKYNRLIKTTHEMTDEQILEKCKLYFKIVEISNLDKIKPKKKGDIALYFSQKQKWFMFVKPEIKDNDYLNLDVQYVTKIVIQDILGFNNFSDKSLFEYFPGMKYDTSWYQSNI